jgi:hypothetical protein
MPELPPGGCDSGPERAGYRLANAVALCVLAAAMALLHLADADGTLPSTCLYRHVTGRPCPGCGLTRSVVLSFDGRLAEARAMHPSGPWIAAWLAGQAVWRLALAAARPRRRSLWVGDLAGSLGTLWLAVYLPMILAQGAA